MALGGKKTSTSVDRGTLVEILLEKLAYSEELSYTKQQNKKQSESEELGLARAGCSRPGHTYCFS
jgi:hypothetical protein